MRHRIFIAINLPEGVKSALFSYQMKWPELPVKWTKKHNLHITLAFLGYLREEEITSILKIVKEAVLKQEPFFINLKKVCYGPTDKKPDTETGSLSGRPDRNRPPRMIWVEGQSSKELGELQKKLDDALSGLSSELKNDKNRAYTPHITLGRLKQWEFRAIEPEERPEINEEIDLSFEVSCVDIMESRSKRSGPEYTILESVYLSK